MFRGPLVVITTLRIAVAAFTFANAVLLFRVVPFESIDRALSQTVEAVEFVEVQRVKVV